MINGCKANKNGDGLHAEIRDQLKGSTMKRNRRDTRVSLAISESELESIKAAAHRYGITVSEFIRESAMDRVNRMNRTEMVISSISMTQPEKFRGLTYS